MKLQNLVAVRNIQYSQTYLYLSGEFTYKFFPMNVHNQTSDSTYNLGIVVGVDNG